MKTPFTLSMRIGDQLEEVDRKIPLLNKPYQLKANLLLFYSKKELLNRSPERISAQN